MGERKRCEEKNKKIDKNFSATDKRRSLRTELPAHLYMRASGDNYKLKSQKY
jgi:hypothetical protein